MIFSKLFQPKYKNKDPLVRIQAVESLESSEPNNKSILHELAFNDADSRVSVAALNKLNNFDLWWKMMEIAKDTRLSKHARAKVEQALLGENDVDISDKAKSAFIKECNNSSLLETLVQKEAVSEQDTDLMLATLGKINKPSLAMRILLNTDNRALQESLFQSVEDEGELGKIIKKSHSEHLTKLASDKLAVLKEAKQKPVLLEKEVKLVLAKLLALTDENHFDKFISGKQALQHQFEVARQQFGILDQALNDSFVEKYQTIAEKLKTKETRLKDDWDVQQELARTSAALNSAKEKCEAVLSQVGEALTHRIAEITLGDLETFNRQITEAEEQLSVMLQAKLSDSEYRGIEQQINRLMKSRTSLDSLPALQQALEQANELIAQFKALTLPDDISQIEAAQTYLDENQARWKALKQDFQAIWPIVMEQQWQALVAEWRSSLGGLRKSVEELTSRVRARLSGISRTIDQGRFKQAMRGYESIQNEFATLPEGQQHRLARQFDKVKEQIENLKDWQEYIATPKKPELLKEIEQLALNPQEPDVQADRVKELRKEWNSLGTTDSETDAVMNKAFNLACEAAFKPCREFYSAQEQQREANLKAKQTLLNELANTAQDNIDDLAKALRLMQNRWKDIGAVDYKSLDVLNETYKKVVDPIKAKVNAFHQENAESKRNILLKAEALLENDDWRAATEEAKSLQTMWRQIGFAGQRQENTLWSAFRKINDQIFARRESAISAQNQQDSEQINAIYAAIQEKVSAFKDSASRSELELYLNEELKQQLQALQQFPRKLTEEPLRAARDLQKQLQEKLLYLGDSQRSEQYLQVFTALGQWHNAELPSVVEDLPNYWRQAFVTMNLADSDLANFSRQQLTLLLEILTDKASPDADSVARKEVQLQLMTLKLQDGLSLDSDEILRAWIAHGPLCEADTLLLERVKQAIA